MPKLGVNIDHVATLRQARRGIEPEPLYAALICELAGADSIVVHLREDRRHINDRDLRLLRELANIRLNLEMSTAEEIVKIALKVKPEQATLVPEKREEITTEGGLDVITNKNRIREVGERLKKEGIVLSLFIDPEKEQIEAARKAGTRFIELHTGRYAEAKKEGEREDRLKELIRSAKFAKDIGLGVNAGHGLNYHNVKPVAEIAEIEELNIGHSLISRAVFVGLERAVKEMLQLMKV